MKNISKYLGSIVITSLFAVIGFAFGGNVVNAAPVLITNPIIILDDIIDPSTPTSISGRIEPAGTPLTTFEMNIQEAQTGNVWDGSSWGFNFTYFPVTENADGTFSSDISSVGFVPGTQYIIGLYLVDSNGQTYYNSQFFTYGDTATISVDIVNNPNQLSGVSNQSPFYLQLYDVDNYYGCWDGSTWNLTTTACDLTPSYDSNTKKWTYDISQIPFIDQHLYEAYVYENNTYTYADRFFFHSASLPTSTLTTVGITPVNPVIAAGGQQQFTASALDQNSNPLSGVAISWSSASTSVATIDSSTGLATVISAGSTVISATAIYNSTVVTSTTTLTINPITSTCVTGADTNADGNISISELLSYIGNWKIGNVSLTLLLNAIGFWKVGVGC